MYFIKTEQGNYFVRTQAIGDMKKEIYFFMSPDGRHLKEKQAFHSQAFYFRCKRKWKKEEGVLPVELIENALIIAGDYFPKKEDSPAIKTS
jgi:hypothetical protein